MPSPIHDARFLLRLAELGRSSDRLWACATASGLAATLAAAFVFPASGMFWAYATVLTRSAAYLWAGDGLRGRGGESIQRLFLMGTVAGCFELLVDYGLVHWVSSGTLVYTTTDVVLLASPVYMPLAWACVITEIGYPALRLYGLWRPRLDAGRAAALASVVVGVSAGVTVGFYEVFAAKAGWWRYEQASTMIGASCALFIPLGEFFMFLPALWIAAGAVAEDKRPVSAVTASGAAFAACIGAGYALAYVLLEA